MSRQNSRDVSSLEVTLNGSQIEIEPVGNATKILEDVKVMLVQGQKGDAGDTYQVAEDFSATKQYYVGDYCCKDGLLYRFTEDHLGAWDANDVVETTVGDEMENFRQVIVTVSSSAWSSTPTDGYYTATLTTLAFSTVIAPKVSCCGQGRGLSPTSAQMSAYRNIQNPNGKIEQVSSTSIKLYAKTKPAETFYIMLSGYGIGTQIDSCALAERVRMPLNIATVDAWGTYYDREYTGENEARIAFKKSIYEVDSGDWSASPNSDGFYTNTVQFGSYGYISTDLVANIYCAGRNEVTRPTSAQISAFRNICEPNGYVECNGDSLTLYAKTKPAIDFYVLVEGVQI